MAYQKIVALLGSDAGYLLHHQSKTASNNLLHCPSPNFVDKAFAQGNRRNLAAWRNHERRAGTGNPSILSADQEIACLVSASFVSNPPYFEPENIIWLANEAGGDAVATTFGNRARPSRKYTRRGPFLSTLNPSKRLPKYNQLMSGSEENARNLIAIAMREIISSEESDHRIGRESVTLGPTYKRGGARVRWSRARNNARFSLTTYTVHE